uniref:Predicted protein n=1 Tax=Hordeum vulgare subsp. vulgare TaxID=112509 RepID=F2E9P6_HORVV|nr:predicted protein [Hordeum vulgare subsp. vulgare]
MSGASLCSLFSFHATEMWVLADRRQRCLAPLRASRAVPLLFFSNHQPTVSKGGGQTAAPPCRRRQLAPLVVPVDFAFAPLRRCLPFVGGALPLAEARRRRSAWLRCMFFAPGGVVFFACFLFAFSDPIRSVLCLRRGDTFVRRLGLRMRVEIERVGAALWRRSLPARPDSVFFAI